MVPDPPRLATRRALLGAAAMVPIAARVPGALGTVRAGASGSGSIAMIGGHSSSQHPRRAIVASFTHLDNSHLDNLVITGFDDQARGAKYHLDQFNNVRASGPGTIGTDTITVSGTAAGVGAFAQSFAIIVHDARSFVPQAKVVFTPAAGHPWIDVTELPVPGTVLGQLSVAGADPVSSPRFGSIQVLADPGSYQAVNVSPAGVVTTTSSFGNQDGIITPGFTASEGGRTYYNTATLFFSCRRDPAKPVAVKAAYVTSTAAPADRSSIVATLTEPVFTGNFYHMADDQDGRFGLRGINGGPDLLVLRPLSPGTYHPVVRISRRVTARDPASSTQLIAIAVTVLDAAPTQGASITAHAPIGLLNNARRGTVIVRPTAAGIPGRRRWCLHQSARMGYTIDEATGIVTNHLPLQWGQHDFTLVCSDGTHNAQTTVTFKVGKTIGPRITVAEHLPMVSGASYPSLTAFFNDFIRQGAGGKSDNPLSGAQVTLKRHSSGSWVDQNNSVNGTYNYFDAPWDLIGDPESADRIDISASPTQAMTKAFFCPVDVDMSVTHIRAHGCHGLKYSTNSRFFLADGTGRGRYEFVDCDFSDCDNAYQGGEGGGVVSFRKCLVRQCGADAYSHNIYVGNVAYMEFIDSVSVGAVAGGHNLKTRAVSGKVSNSRIMDLNGGSVSTGLDIPNGGHYLIANTLFHTGPNDQNWQSVNFHPENNVANQAIDVLLVDRAMFMSDDVDSGQPSTGVTCFSRARGTNAIVIQSGVAGYGLSHGTAAIDSASGNAYAPIGLDLSARSLTARPALAYLDPATGRAPTYQPAPPYNFPAAPHGGAWGRAQSIRGGDIITVRASAPDGTIIDTYSLVTSVAGEASFEPRSAATYPAITHPVWSIGTSAAAAAAAAQRVAPGQPFSIGNPAGGNVAGLAIDPATGVLTKRGRLTPGPRKVCVMAMQEGRWPKAKNFTIMVEA